MQKLIYWSFGLLLLLATSCSPSTNSTPVRIRLQQDPESLHPISYGNAYALQILNLLYQSLLTIDYSDKTIQPLLVKGLPHVRVEDSLSYFTFELRPEARWDDGKPVTVADIAFSLKLLQSPGFDNERWQAQYAFIKDIELPKENPGTFTIVCRGYTSEMRLLVGDFFIVPESKYDPKKLLSSFTLPFIREKFDSLATTVTFATVATHILQQAFARDTAYVKGSGPYQLVSWATGQHLLLQKKKQWWADEIIPPVKPLINRPNQILFQIIPDNAAATLALKAGQLDVMENIPLVAFQEMLKDQALEKEFTFHHPPVFDLVFMGINGSNPKLEDKRTRQALAHLLDVDLIIKNLLGGYATPTVGLVHPSEKHFYHAGLPKLPFDPSRSNKLLMQAGWQKTTKGWQKKINGKTQLLELELILRAGNTDFENMGILLQQNAKALGIPITITALESSQISDRLQQRTFDLYFRTYAGNPYSYNFVPLFHTSNAEGEGANVTSFGTPETDILLEKIAVTGEPSTKATLLKDLQQKMQEESNLVFLYFQQNKIAISSRLDSVVVSSIKPGYDVGKFMLKK